MQTQSIVLIPPTHEQSTPSFHVQAALFERFLEFLRENQVPVTEEPSSLGRPGGDGQPVCEIQIEAGTPIDRLENLKAAFQRELAS